MIHQIEVRFGAALKSASLLDPGAARPAVSPAVKQEPAAVKESPPHTLWETEIGRQLVQDRETISSVLKNLSDRIGALDERHRQRLDEWQRAAVELAIAIASRLVHDTIQAGAMPIEEVVREAAVRLKPDQPISIHLHPADHVLLRKRLGDKPLFPDRTNVVVADDAVLGRGDCRVEGKDVTVLSELGVQLNAMRQHLLESLGHAQS